MEIRDSVKDHVKWALERMYHDGWEEGYVSAKEDYNKQRGIAHCRKATDEEIEMHGIELWGWCDCGRPIIGRWAGLAKFCPWCGKAIEWDKEDKK